jgi:hypothetical protein
MANTDPHYIDFDDATIERLQAHYLDAIDDGKIEFLFDGIPMYTAYAKYLMEYYDLCHEKKEKVSNENDQAQ